MNIQKGLLSIVAAVGGSGVIIVALSVWLGNLFASQISASTEANYQKDIKRLESTLELNRTRQIRSSEARFALYSEVWIQLMDLKSAGDRLWENASLENLENFVMLLDKARLATDRGRLILKEKHYQDLQSVPSLFYQLIYYKNECFYHWICPKLCFWAYLFLDYGNKP